MFPRRVCAFNVAMIIALVLAVAPTQKPVGEVYAQTATFSITGRVTDGEGNGVPDVVVSADPFDQKIYFPLIDPAMSSGPTSVVTAEAVSPYVAITDTDGYYTIVEVPGSVSTYTVTAKRDGIEFTPLLQRVTPTDAANKDFQIKIVQPVISPPTEVISPETNQYLEPVAIDQQQLIFTQTTPELQTLVVGNILVSDATESAPSGYLRKVTGVSRQNGDVVVDTVPAVLEEAVQNGSAFFQDALSPADIVTTTALAGVQMLPAAVDAPMTFSFEVNNVILYDADGNAHTTGDQVKANGSIEFEMEFDFYLNIQGSELRSLTFSDRTTLRDTIEIMSQIELARIDEEFILASHDFAPLTIMIGPVPVVIVPCLEIIVGVDGSVNLGITTSLSHELGIRAGVRYNYLTGWKPISELTSQFTFIPPQLSLEATVRGYYGARFNLYLYGVAGPYVRVTPFLELKIVPFGTPRWILYAGIDVPAGFKVSQEVKDIAAWIGLELKDFEVAAITYKVIVAQEQTGNHAPYVPSSPSPTSGAGLVSTSPILSWVSGDPDGDAVTYDIFFEAWDTSPDVLVSENQTAVSFTPSTLETSTLYYWQVRVTDEHNTVTGGPVWNFTTETGNHPPNVPSNPIPVDQATGQSLNIHLYWNGGDPDGDIVTYDVYLEAGDNTPDVHVSDDQALPDYDPGLLIANTTYYWQIISRDDHNVFTFGPVWSFTTANGVVPGEMVLIPAGSFQMGCDPAHNGNYECDFYELPLHAITLDAYWIDKYEVTNAQYAECVAASDCAAPQFTSSFTRSSYYGNPVYDYFPVINVSWQDAANFCAWADKRLPTEAEWEKAARGTADTRAYPWGDQDPDCSHANIWDNTTFNYCVGDTNSVGSYPLGASPYGVMDMAGNVWEWVSDWFGPSYYISSPGTNPPGPSFGTSKVMRGGGWRDDYWFQRVAGRQTGSTEPTIGFRCAAPAP